MYFRSTGDQRVADRLRLRRGHGNDADMDVHVAADAAKLAHGEHLLAGDFAAAQVGVYVKRGNNAQAIRFKPAIGEQCASEAARANEHRVVGVVISKGALNRGDQLARLKTGLRLPGGIANRGKVLSNLNFV